MLLQHLRKPVLAAALALLALPGAALATDDNGSPHAKSVPPPAGQTVSNETCAYLEINIPGYSCTITLAQYAGQQGLPEKPDGVDYRFWEENVWELQGDVAEAPGDETPPHRTANRPSDRGVGFY